MSWLDIVLGRMPPEEPARETVIPEPVIAVVAAVAGEATARELTRAEAQVLRYARAIEQCAVMVERGEKPQSRLDQLRAEMARWQALAAIGEGLA